MENNFKRNVSLTGAIRFTGIRIGEPVRTAAGFLGVKEALRHSFKEMGVFRSTKALLKMNQEDGFRCPSCAWPVPKELSKIAEYCENGAKALADEATTDRIGADFFATHSVEELSQLTDYELNKLGRITGPLVLRPDEIYYEPIAWQDAYGLIAEELGRLDNPNEAIFYTSGRSSNEAAFLYGMFARAFGTNNMPDCSNMCHESSGVALLETLGIGKGSTTMEDLYNAEVIITAGQNPGTNHPRMLSALEKCKRNGGKIISINPLAETGLVHFKNPQKVGDMLGNGTTIADIHLPVKINEDIALMKLILKKLVRLNAQKGDVFDREFIEKHTDGYETLLNDLATYNEAELLARTGVPEQDIEKTVALLATSSKIVVCWAMGLTQHKNAVETIREYVNLILLKGAIGKPGAGTFPVRGHSNVQGDRSVGIMHFVNEGFNKRIEEHMGFTPPTEHGHDVMGAIRAMYEGKAKVFICLGGNFVMAASDTEYTAEAIQNCSLTVQISTKLNRSHLITGKTALLLPTFGRSEKDMKNGKLQFLTMESSTGKVRQSRGLLKPASGHIKSEPEIIASMAHTYFKGGHPVDWEALGHDYDLIRSYIDKTVKGFENTGDRSKGFGYYLPNNAREGDFSMLPNGKAQLTVNALSENSIKKDELLLMTFRSHDQFNTTIYGLDDRYRGVYNERRVIFMNAEDMRKRGLKKMDVIDLHSEYDGKKRTARQFLVVPYDIPRGNAAAYYPETNILVPHNRFDPKSRQAVSKSVRVTVESMK
ncbi:FdhF/YdeP family oxidoreductase [Sinomicrobium weinanense]|uniref:FdhF/YdeP family oxidoreductase n=1 Tax=Sinomicrobium weinanense TaxID=2842200 RepID=A0A926JTX2_9FLAO|nr:FdhF/YdeP family oxidoreductase [Sinomicrobium weinanense]MBC9797249.1 FdhF/YdeP family oxidoreductase [Sinomicrobium weinanense]MBU3122349.1 FdhF/YdeP family oxidoreductase [Sinomicrobium weinanense]